MRNRTLAVLGVAALGLLSLSASCPPKPPNPQPTPTPTPPPSGQKYANLLLARSATVFTDILGKPVVLVGEASCCFSEDPEPDPGWALASRAFIKRTADHGGNLIHIRLGPYRVQPDWGTEQQSAGSPYLEVGGKADLTQWDPKFWAYLVDKFEYAGSLGVRLEIDIADGWGIKWQKWRPAQFPQGHPWVASSNVQGEDWITSAGTRAPVGVHEAWIRKVVQVSGAYGNVIYQVGNEDAQVPGATPEWEVGTCNVVHSEERVRDYLVHLCGSNAPDLAANRVEIDYLTTHDDPPFTQAQCRDTTRPCRQSEDNNSYSGQLWGQLFCDARAKGLYRDFWRAEMPLVEAQAAWAFMAPNGCASAGPLGCYNIPDQDAVQVLPKPQPMQSVVDSVNGALSALHPECAVGSNCPIQEPLQQFLQRFAAQVRLNPAMCAGIQTTPEGPVDEVCVGEKFPGTSQCNVCQGNHVYACKSGCTTGTVSWAPGSYVRASDTWARPEAVPLFAAEGLVTMSTHPHPAMVARSKPVADQKHRVDKRSTRGRIER